MSKTMLDKIGIIGDVMTAFNRLGIDTLAVVCVGGSSGTAVKVVTCDTVGGDYTDFLTLKADAENINEGFCFSLIGAKKFVKITGCDNAIGIVGDCDYDVKEVTFNTVTVAGADLENNKTATIDVSEYTEPVEITPTAGKDGMKKATVTLSNIPSGGSATAYCWKVQDTEYYFWTDFNVAPTTQEEFIAKKFLSFGLNSVEGAEVVVYVGKINSTQWLDGATFKEKVAEDAFVITEEGDDYTYVRYDTKDFTLW